jgi:coenzyme F420 hydrogenase subunit beta
MARINNVQQIADWRLCLGCGACAYVCPEQRIRLVDFVGEGIRPVIGVDHCASCVECLDVCPAFKNDHTEINRRPGAIPELTQYCGPVLEIWEGHATDREIRFTGASGGVITALALYCLEKEAMHGVLHIGMDLQDALRNRTRLSRTRAELLSNAGSRYAPASACDSLHLIESAPAPCVFIGQPAEVTALRKAEQLRPALGQKVGLTISFFCAGSPATRGTFDLLKKMGVKPDDVQDLRYRGRGWPGLFSATLKGQSKPALQMSYQESWGFVQAYRPFSTHLAPDGTGEDADIACGDPWYREITGDEPGSSLVLVRTETGRRLLRGAMATGYVTLTPAESWKLMSSQKNLMAKRGAIGGRVAMMKMLGLPVPRLRGFSLFKNWRRSSLEEKLRSTIGTIRRIITRRYHRPLRLKASEGENRSVLRKTEGVSRNVPGKFSPVEAEATRI